MLTQQQAMNTYEAWRNISTHSYPRYETSCRYGVYERSMGNFLEKKKGSILGSYKDFCLHDRTSS